MNYDGLKPGVHFYVGDKKIKSLSLTDSDEWARIFNLDDGSRTQSAEALQAQVAYVFIALGYRRDMIGQIETEWTRNEEPLPIT